MYRVIIFSFFIFLLYACGEKSMESKMDMKDNKENSLTAKEYYNEKHRPQFHFSPEANWMNDPNGMVYHEGEYHLFYQYYPEATVWGPMHWGHAISEDLVHWEHLPIGLYPDSLGWIFSGSAVVDKNNTSGFGKNGKDPLVAIFSHHSQPIEKTGSDKFQYQSIAYSNDKGRTWTMYEGNPVVPNPGIRDFRDPKVIWHDQTQKWIMTVTALDHIKFYASSNLKNWDYLSDFGKTVGSHDGVWECPDLFPLVDDLGQKKWVLLQNMNPGNPNGGSGCQYFIGDFDGKKFTLDPDFAEMLGTIPASYPKGKIFMNFENGFEDWIAKGNAFGTSPVSKSNTGKVKIDGVEGNYFAGSSDKDLSAIGTLTSPEFVISSKAINFKISGGNHRGRTLIKLVVEGNTLREAEGRNTNKMRWAGWDVSKHQGKKAKIVLVDKHTTDWGHINVDQITFADKLAHEEKSGSVWLDAGRDNYAGVTWSDVPAEDGRRIFIGWLSNWAYAQVVPTEKWRSAMTIPWELSLKNVDGVPRIVSSPVRELQSIEKSESNLSKETSSYHFENGLARFDLNLKIDKTKNTGFKIRNTKNEFVEFLYKPSNNELSFDRRKSGDLSFSPEFTSVSKVNRLSKDDILQLTIFIDHSSVEIFIDNGLNVFTEIFFPTEPFEYLDLNEDTKILNGSMKILNGIW